MSEYKRQNKKPICIEIIFTIIHVWMNGPRTHLKSDHRAYQIFCFCFFFFGEYKHRVKPFVNIERKSASFIGYDLMVTKSLRNQIFIKYLKGKPRWANNSGAPPTTTTPAIQYLIEEKQCTDFPSLVIA